MLEVTHFFPWGGSAQAPHDHEMVRVVPWVLDRHVLEDMAVGSQDIVRPGPNYPPLTNYYPRPPIPSPRLPSQEKVSRKILQACRRHRRRDILFPSLPTHLLKVHVQVIHNNQINPYWPLGYCRLHVSNCRPVYWHQVASDNVPAPLPHRQLAHNDVCIKMTYHLDYEGGGVLI